MAIRPIFIPKTSDSVGVDELMIDFKWHPGLSKSQKQKSIIELHKKSIERGYKSILEISSKSELELGVELSAFNLLIVTKKYKQSMTVETAFQGSKVFSNGGPYKDLFGLNSLAAKKDMRLRESGRLVKFEFFGKVFPLEPKTFFYDWLYINALIKHKDLTRGVMSYDAFSDIEFNPEKSVNCQAHSVALYVSLTKLNLLNRALMSPDNFLSVLAKHYERQRRIMNIQVPLT